jgi:LCP family protein required for cell wall assembly
MTRTRRIREAKRAERLGRDPSIDPRWFSQSSEEVVAAPRSVSPRRLLLTISLVIVVGLSAGGFLLWQRVAAFNDSVSTSGSLSSSLLLPLQGSERVNVAIFGYAGEAGHGGTYLADSINILSIDPATDTTTLIAIPRDLWVEGSPRMPANGKINEVFSLGFAAGGVVEAGTASVEVLSQVTGLKIDHWIALDFAGLRAAVDAVGGVTVENPRAFAYTFNEAYYYAGVWDGGEFAAGVLELDGAHALDYARTRYTSVSEESSDFARSARQQRVLSALRTKMGGGGAASLGPALAVMEVLPGHFNTDVSALDLLLLSGSLSPDARISLEQGVILDATSTDTGQYVLVVIGRGSGSDYAPLHAYLAAKLAEPIPTPFPTPTSSAGT